MMPSQFTGYLFALSSAFLWAVVSILYKNMGKEIVPAGMNIGKNLVAILCTGILLFITGFKPIQNKILFCLIGSGIFGIALGDTFFFMSIKKLQLNIALLMTTLIPVITVLFAAIFLNERPSFKSWIGISLTIAGIGIVLLKNNPSRVITQISLSGIIYGLFTSFFCALSIILSKFSLASTSALEASFIRHLSASLILLCYGLMNRRLKSWLNPLVTNTSLINRLFFASFLGTFLGTWFCLLGLKFATASIAAILNSTSPLFIIPLSHAILKEKKSGKDIIGALVAVTGVGIIIIGG